MDNPSSEIVPLKLDVLENESITKSSKISLVTEIFTLNMSASETDSPGNPSISKMPSILNEVSSEETRLVFSAGSPLSDSEKIVAAFAAPRQQETAAIAATSVLIDFMDLPQP